MYDNDYFKEVMGKQYKEDDLFETDNRNNHNYIVITPENNYNTIQVNSNNKEDDKINIGKDISKNKREETVMRSENNDNKNTIKQAEDKNVEDAIKKAENKNVEDTIKKAEEKIEKPIKMVENKVKDVEHEVTRVSANIKSDFDKLYPEIYKIINPMIEVAINRNKDKGITNDTLEKIANGIYYAIEGYEGNNCVLVSKNEGSSILYDLIKILLLDKVANKINYNANDNTNNNKNDSKELANNKRNDENKNISVNNLNTINKNEVANNSSEKIEGNKSINVSNLNTINKSGIANNLNEQVNDNKTIAVSNPNVLHTDKAINQQSNVSNVPKVSYFDIPYPEDA